ncbi:hypothetical protein GE061_011169 [Apolygus lucorum]|uniref:Uncharacterized protein n=1 Tax=Apolygus lucorum TaxID=248454 RepID=A0A8S9XWN1_APOLU|nr:hypothetical protein GE061_011169 [Apolygus lucorum]
MPNCVFSEDEIAHGSDARYSEGPVTTSTDEKPADEATSNKVIDGSGTSGNQESVESSKRSNFSDDYPNDVPDYENFAYGTFENYEKTPSEGWKPSTTAIVQHIPSAKNATDENSKLIWTKAKNTSTLDKHKGSARGSRLYYCYKLIAISKDGEQFTIRGCTRKAHACFTGNYQAVDHYDCTVLCYVLMDQVASSSISVIDVQDASHSLVCYVCSTEKHKSCNDPVTQTSLLHLPVYQCSKYLDGNDTPDSKRIPLNSYHPERLLGPPITYKSTIIATTTMEKSLSTSESRSAVENIEVPSKEVPEVPHLILGSSKGIVKLINHTYEPYIQSSPPTQEYTENVTENPQVGTPVEAKNNSSRTIPIVRKKHRYYCYKVVGKENGSTVVQHGETKNIYDRSLSCYECSSEDTLSCNSPLDFDTKVYMTACSDDSTNNTETTPDTYDFGPEYHPTKTRFSKRKLIEKAFGNYKPEMFSNDTFWGLKKSIWIDDESFHPHQSTEGGQPNRSEKSRNMISRQSQGNYACFIVKVGHETLRGCTPNMMRDSEICPTLRSELNLTSGSYYCYFCKFSLCNITHEHSTPSILTFLLFMGLWYFIPIFVVQ